MIRIICIGRTEPMELKNLQNYYLKLISKYTKVEIIEVKTNSYRDEQKAIAIKEECQKLLKCIKYKPILLDVNGKLLTTNELSNLIFKYLNFGIDFIVGGVWGVCDEIKKFESISLSKMVFNHNLIRIMLIEQIYRSFNPKFNK